MIFKINISKFSPLILLTIIILHLFILTNNLFTLWPEMVVYPYLFNNGFLLYKDIINPYPPGFTFILSLVGRAFGYFPLPYQIFTWLVIILIDFLIYTIVLKISKKSQLAIVSTLSFVLISVPFGINGLWFDLVQTPFILAAFFYFYTYLKSNNFSKLLLSFLFITISFFIKQQAAWLAFWFLFYLFFKLKDKNGLNLKKIFLLSTPFLILLILHFLYFVRSDIFKEFYFWIVNFPIFKSNSPGYIQLPTLKQIAVLVSLFVLSIPMFKSKNYRLRIIPITALLLLLFAYPRFEYFHLIPSIAVLSLSLGISVPFFLKEQLLTKMFYLIAAVFLLTFSARTYYLNWGHDVRFFEPEIFAAAEYLSQNSSPDDLIYIQNGPDQLLALAKRLPPKPWADELPWYLELEGVQPKILNGLQLHSPKLVIFKPYTEGEKFELGAYQPQLISNYIDENYPKIVKISPTLWEKSKN